VPFGWVAADIEMALLRVGKAYVLGVNANHHFGSWSGKPPVAGTASGIAQGLDPSA
jgi:SRSO17 transposase